VSRILRTLRRGHVHYPDKLEAGGRVVVGEGAELGRTPRETPSTWPARVQGVALRGAEVSVYAAGGVFLGIRPDPRMTPEAWRDRLDAGIRESPRRFVKNILGAWWLASPGRRPAVGRRAGAPERRGPLAAHGPGPASPSAGSRTPDSLGGTGAPPRESAIVPACGKTQRTGGERRERGRAGGGPSSGRVGLRMVRNFSMACLLASIVLLSFLRPLDITVLETCSDRPEPPLLSSDEGIPILMYHEIGDAANELYVSRTQFIAQMDYLVAHGYTTISFEDLLAHWTEGAPLPEHPVLITFDDGYSSAYSVAVEVLAERGLTATFFIPTGLVGEPNRVTWPELVEMCFAGFTIASHSVSHPYLATCDAAALKEELALSKQVLDENLSTEVLALCYPFGQFNETVLRTARECGYQVAVTTQVAVSGKEHDIMALPRLPVYRRLDMEGFGRLLRGVFDEPD